MSLESYASGPSSDTAAGDIVSILVSPDGPYGVKFEADKDGNAAVIKEFERLPNGKFGPLQKHGGLHHGDVLFAINDIQLDSVAFEDALIIVNDRNILKKTFKFMNIREYYRRRRTSTNMSAIGSDRSNFLTSIRRYRVSEDESGRKFVEYEVACQFRAAGARVQKDIVYKWIVWKRYSEFEKLHSQLRSSLGWQLEGIEFPSAYTFSLNKLSPEFIDQRRDELNRYWQRVVAIEKVSDFTKHHCSQEIKAFIGVDDAMKNDKVASAEVAPDKDDRVEDKRQSRKGIGRQTSLRRRSANSSARDDISTAVSVDDTVQPANTRPASIPPPPPRPNSVAIAKESLSEPIPKATGARVNLLGDIAALRKDY